MKLYLLEGDVIHRCGELSVEEPFQGFVQNYFIGVDYVGFDGYRFPATEVAITKVTEVNSNTSQRLRLSSQPKMRWVNVLQYVTYVLSLMLCWKHCKRVGICAA